MRALYPPLYRTVFQMIPRGEDVEEILQDTFFRFYKALRRVREGEDPFPFLRTIATRCTYTFMKSRRAHFVSLEDLPGDLPDLTIENRSLGVEDLYLWAQELPPKRRLVFLLREIEGHSTAEIADLMKLREPTVRRHASLAREAFLKKFGG